LSVQSVIQVTLSSFEFGLLLFLSFCKGDLSVNQAIFPLSKFRISLCCTNQILSFTAKQTFLSFFEFGFSLLFSLFNGTLLLSLHQVVFSLKSQKEEPAPFTERHISLLINTVLQQCPHKQLTRDAEA